ncbi:MAG: hypothetical protein L0170_08845 [Acidobacteria bacterium]|nr:hypothetical protein [Acidobacteriota bacterium]
MNAGEAARISIRKGRAAFAKGEYDEHQARIAEALRGLERMRIYEAALRDALA